MKRYVLELSKNARQKLCLELGWASHVYVQDYARTVPIGMSRTEISQEIAMQPLGKASSFLDNIGSLEIQAYTPNPYQARIFQNDHLVGDLSEADARLYAEFIARCSPKDLIKDDFRIVEITGPLTRNDLLEMGRRNSF